MNLKEIDKLIAEKVMGWEFYEDGESWITENGHLFFSDDDSNEWSPSTNIQDAWLVVDNLDFDLKITKFGDIKTKYMVHAFIPNNIKIAIAESAPLAICLAALRSVGVEVER